ncbi:aldose epimerase family protein [Flavicella marina]|uniref:aldose epimerase family protein n=1 Tax=Flavicella marina TaxID=1475951 RepID=UPI00126474D1|nr:aldose epimerase family protein [Flavicella marina]
MSIQIVKFGEYEGKTINQYILSNSNGIEVSIMNYGATITSLKVPNSNGNIENIACGFDTLEGYFDKTYLENSPYFGGTIGRYCSQIKDATFTLNNRNYTLAKNCGDNNLHGGNQGFDKRVWQAKEIKNGVEMTLLSKDLEEGFPGNVYVKVSFTLSDSNELKIGYSATTDQDTPLSLTNHTYFNLDAFSSNIENHKITIHSHLKQVMDQSGAGTGEITDVVNKVDDLTNGKIINEAHIAMGDGFEHFYIFEDDFKLKELANIQSDKSGRKLTVFSNEPCMLFYTGKYTSDEIKRENGEQYGKYRGFCFETHRYQNGPNLENSPKSITKAGEEFSSTTVFKFDW